MNELLIVVIVVLALVALNGLFVAAEFAIIGTSRAAMAARGAKGDRLARTVTGILEDPVRLDRYVATAQLGITFASLGLGMYGEHKLAGFIEGWLLMAGFEGIGATVSAHGVAVIIAISAMTYMHIVFGEMIPKSLALTHAMRTALWVSRPMLLIGMVFYPFVRVLNFVGNTLLRLVGFTRGHGSGHYYSTDELDSVARESLAGGLLGQESGRLFQEMIDFSSISAGEAMVPRVRMHGIALDCGLGGLREIVTSHRHTRYPVYEGSLDGIIGSVHVKDLLGLLRKSQPLTRAVVRETAFVPEGATLEDVLSAMRRVRNQLVVVMDEHGGTAGMVTMEDICAEAVGDFEEGADDMPDVLAVGKRGHQVQGTVRLDTLGDLLGLELVHEDVDTVSGLILSELGRPPLKGDCVHWGGLRFDVASVRGRGVLQALVSTDPSAAPRVDGVQ
ncbi:hemolysin family protein [Lysobacter sp. A289]